MEVFAMPDKMVTIVGRYAGTDVHWVSGSYLVSGKFAHFSFKSLCHNLCIHIYCTCSVSPLYKRQNYSLLFQQFIFRLK